MQTRLLVFSAFTIFAATSLSAGAQEIGIAVGKRAPSAIVQTLDGKAVDLGSYVGRTPVLIEFWATWCGNCHELMPALTAAQKKFGKKVKFVVLAVAINQSPERVRKYVAAHPGHEILFDTDGKAAAQFDAPATSYVVILDKAGRVVYTGLGGKQNLDAALAKTL